MDHMLDGKFILLVDDDVGIRTIVAEILEEEGYHVVIASDGHEALTFLRRTRARPALILLDLMMPHTDGWAFRSEQRHDPLLKSIPVAVFSAREHLQDVMRLAAADFVPKPVTYDQLMTTVQRFCRPDSMNL